jgi:uncharacterized peroxidase-related enzyme
VQRIKAVSDRDVPEGSKAILAAVTKKQGAVTNFIKTLAHSPAALRFYLSQAEALSAGVLSKQLREQIALVAAGANNCDYCASVHTFIGKRTGLDAVELAANISGHSADPKTHAALRFVREIVNNLGHLTDLDLGAIQEAGYGDEEIVEIIAHVGMNIFTNYFNDIAKTTIDFPSVSTARAIPV